MANDMNLKVNVVLDPNQGYKEFNSWSNKVQAQVNKNPIKVKIDIDGQQYEKSIETWVGKNHDLVEVTKLVNVATKQEIEYISKVEDGMSRLASATSNQTNQTRNLTSAQSKLNAHTQKSISIFRDFTNTFLKMAKFNTINMIYDGIINKMSEAIKITNDFDKAMTEFKKVTDTSNLSLSDYTNTLGEYGESVARTQTQMLEAATEFSKSGFNAETSAQLAQVASLFQNIADSEISASDAASFIISQMKAFNIEADDATSILDKINEVSNNFSVSSTDITSALTKQSASLAAYGNDLNKSVALVTAGTEIMTGQAGKVARGLRTIGANITQLAQSAKSFDITVHGATKTIQLWNETGTDMLDTYDVLKQISAEWKNMTNAEKSSLAIDLAKKTQMDTFLATLSNFEDAEKAYTTALLSEGSAWKENEKYMESIEAHQAKLQQQWEQLVLSKPVEDLEKSLLNAGTALLKFANSDIGQTIIKITAFLSVLQLLNVAFAHLNAAILSAPMGSFLASIRMLIAGTGTLTGVVNALTTSLLANPLFWGAAAVVGIVAIVKALDALIVSYNEQIEKLEELQKAYNDAQSEIESVENKLKELSKLQSELEEKKLKITDPKQLSELQQQTDELERQRASLERQLVLAKQKADEAEREAKATAESALTKKTKVQVTTTGYGSFEYHGTSPEVFQKEISEMKRLQAQIIENNKALATLKENESENSKEIEKLTKKNSALVEQFNKMESEAAKTAEELGNISDTLGDVSVNVGDHNELVSSLLNSFSNFVGWNREATDASNEFANSLDNTNDELDETDDNVEDISDSYTTFFDKLEEIQNAYETLSKAAKEYNENGSITASTLKKLNNLSPEYLAALKNEGGQYSVNVELLKNLYDAEQKDAIAKLELAKDSALCKLANEYLTEATDNVTTAVTNSGNEAKTAAPKYEELATSAGNAALKMREVHEYLVGGEGDDSSRWEEFKKQWEETSNWFDQQIENVKNSNIGLAESSSKSASSHKDAWVEAFKEEQRQLKHALEMNEITEIEYYDKLKTLNEKYFGEASGMHQKYLKEYQENEEEIYKGLKSVYDKVKDYLKEAVEQGYEKAIKALQKEEKKMIDGIKKSIDALKKEKSNTLDGIKDEINSLKKQKENIQKYYNDQIDAIKKENEVLQEQNELLEYQQALQQAKAQKVMIFQDGKFQLGENESAVAQAEQNLSNYQDQQSYEQQIQQLEDLRDAQVESIEARIESLEEYYDYMEDYYDKQIEAMEEYRDRVQEQYDAQVEALQAELDAFKEGYQKTEDLENARLASQALGVNERSLLYEQDLENLKNYINATNKMLLALGEAGVTVGNDYQGIKVSSQGVSNIEGVDTAIQHRASGDSNFRGNEIALVGESPNTELVLGSKLNHSVNSGSLINLSKGSGVVNAESTATLAGLLNGLSSPTVSNSSRTVQQNFSFGSISLPSVTDGNSFVKTLSTQFNNYAIQYSTMKH